MLCPGFGQNPALRNVWHSPRLTLADGELAPHCNMWLKGVDKEREFQALIVSHSPSPVALICVLSQVLSGYNYEISLRTDPTRSGHSPLMGKCVVLNQEKCYGETCCLLTAKVNGENSKSSPTEMAPYTKFGSFSLQEDYTALKQCDLYCQEKNPTLMGKPLEETCAVTGG